MNRRDLSKLVIPLFGMGALPVAIAEADTSLESPGRTDSDDDKFYAVYMFDPSKIDFVVRGVYTLESDASTHAERLKSADCKSAGYCVANRAWLQSMFIGNRLGSLQEVLERLEARLMIDAHRG